MSSLTAVNTFRSNIIVPLYSAFNLQFYIVVSRVCVKWGCLNFLGCLFEIFAPSNHVTSYCLRTDLDIIKVGREYGGKLKHSVTSPKPHSCMKILENGSHATLTGGYIQLSINQNLKCCSSVLGAQNSTIQYMGGDQHVVYLA